MFGVERAQRVQLDALAHLLGELLGVGAQMRLQALAVLVAGGRAAEARQAQADRGDVQLVEQRGEQADRLGVDRGVLGAERLGADLPELAVAPGLGALVAEEARQVPQPHGLAELVHAVLDVCPADRRGALRAQGQRASGGVLEGVHLLAHDVGGCADAAREQLGRLERGRLDALIAGALQDRASAVLERRARGGLLAEHVEGAAGRFDAVGLAQLPLVPSGRDVPRSAGAGGDTAGGRRRSSTRNGFVSSSRPSVVMPMWPG